MLVRTSVVILWMLGAVSAFGQSCDGTWKWSSDISGQTIESVLHLYSDGDECYGDYADQYMATEIESFEIDGEKISFEVNGDFNDVEVAAKFSGVLKGETLAGKVSLVAGGQEMGDFDWKPTRSVGLDEVQGTWEFEFTAPDGTEYSPVLIVKESEGKATGTLSGKDIGELSIKENQFSFDTVVDYSGNDMKLSYRCMPRGNKLTGTLAYDLGGNSGEFDIAAKRKVLSREAKALLGEWEFSMTGPDGVDRDVMLTLKEADGMLAATLVGDGREFELDDLKSEGSSVSFDFTNEHDGLEVKLQWQSELSSKGKMEGTLEFDVEGNVGEIPISGKLKS